MLSLTTLASGSSGNCLLVSDGSTHLLLDAGISARRITRALREFSMEPSELAGVLITHEHSDHISGLTTLTKQFHLPVFASHGTGRQLCYRIAALEDVLHPFEPGDALMIGDLQVTSFATPHDTPSSVGYTVTDGKRKAAVITDLGIVTEEVRRHAEECHLLVVETNHEPEWVASGPYPAFLKARILGDLGHLSNEAGAELACCAVAHNARTVVLAHLSAENNTPTRALDTVCAHLGHIGVRPGTDVAVAVAPRTEFGKRYEV